MLRPFCRAVILPPRRRKKSLGRLCCDGWPNRLIPERDRDKGCEYRGGDRVASHQPWLSCASLSCWSIRPGPATRKSPMDARNTRG